MILVTALYTEILIMLVIFQVARSVVKSNECALQMQLVSGIKNRYMILTFILNELTRRKLGVVRF